MSERALWFWLGWFCAGALCLLVLWVLTPSCSPVGDGTEMCFPRWIFW